MINKAQLANIYYMEMLSLLKTDDKVNAGDIYKEFSDMIEK